MSSEVEIRGLEIADDTELRKQEVRIGNVWIPTPIKSIDPKTLYSKQTFPRQKEISEMFKKIKPESLPKFFDDKKEEVKISNEIQNLKLKGGVDNPSFVIIQFDSFNYPSLEETNMLARLSHTFSDVTPIPSIPKVARKVNASTINNLFDYIKSCIKKLKEINKKPIMGYLPSLAPIFSEQLIELYLNEGINSYYIDFDGTLITSHLLQIDAIKRKLNERGYQEKHFIHYINAKYGSTAINNTNIIPAQDIIGFIKGMDSFGGTHVGSRKTPEYIEWLKEHKNISDNLIRLFDKDGYGYHRLMSRNKEDIKKIYPADSIIPFDTIEFSKKSVTKRVSEIVNLQQQIAETNNISVKVHEDPGKTINYFENKKFLSKSIINKLRK